MEGDVRGSRALLLRYLMVGGASVAIDVGLLALLHGVADVPLGPATAVAFLASLVFNFLCNRVTMTGGQRRGLPRHMVRYALLVVANLAVTVLVVTGAARVGVPYLLAKIVVVAASTCWNFVLYRRWVFAEPGPRSV